MKRFFAGPSNSLIYIIPLYSCFLSVSTKVTTKFHVEWSWFRLIIYTSDAQNYTNLKFFKNPFDITPICKPIAANRFFSINLVDMTLYELI